MARKKSFRIEALSQDSKKVFDVLNEQTDIAIVMIGAAWIDECVRTLLQEHFIKSQVTDKLLNPAGGALGNYSVRCDIAYGLKLINKRIYQNLNFIGQIRNNFAHTHISLGFDDQEIRDLCEQISTPLKSYFEQTDIEDESHPTQEQLTIRARNIFKLSIAFIGNQILLDSYAVRRKS